MDSLCTPNQSLPLGSPVADTNRAGCSLVVHTCFPHHTRTPHRGASLKKPKQQQAEQPWRRMGTARPVLPGFWLSWDNEVMLVPVTAPPKEDTW